MHTTPRLVRVVWLDARGQAGWAADPLYENPPMYSVGYWVGEKEDSTYVAATWDGHGGNMADVACIPTRTIVEIVDLVDKPKRKKRKA